MCGESMRDHKLEHLIHNLGFEIEKYELLGPPVSFIGTYHRWMLWDHRLHMTVFFSQKDIGDGKRIQDYEQMLYEKLLLRRRNFEKYETEGESECGL